MTTDDQVKLIRENQSAYIPLGAAHRIENPGKGARMTSSATEKSMMSARARRADIGLISPEVLARQYRAAPCRVNGTGSLDLN